MLPYYVVKCRIRSLDRSYIVMYTQKANGFKNSQLLSRLRSSASPVLTATGLVNGRWRFSTPCRIDTINRRQKICHRWLHQRPPIAVPYLVYIRPRGLLGEWLKYNWNLFIYLFIYAPFSGTQLQVRRVDWSSRMVSQRTRTRTRMCAFVFRWHCSPFRGKIRQKRGGVFKPNSWNRKTCILTKLLHRFQPNFAQR